MVPFPPHPRRSVKQEAEDGCRRRFPCVLVLEINKDGALLYQQRPGPMLPGFSSNNIPSKNRKLVLMTSLLPPQVPGKLEGTQSSLIKQMGRLSLQEGKRHTKNHSVYQGTARDLHF